MRFNGMRFYLMLALLRADTLNEVNGQDFTWFHWVFSEQDLAEYTPLCGCVIRDSYWPFTGLQFSGLEVIEDRSGALHIRR